MDKRGSFAFGVYVSVVLVLVAFISAYPFIQKSISTTTGLGEGIFDESSEKEIDGYELFIKDLRACVSFQKSNCWCNIDYAKLYGSLKDPLVGDQVVFFSDGDKLTLYRGSSKYLPVKNEDSVIEFYGGMFSYGFKYFNYGSSTGVTQIPKIPFIVTKDTLVSSAISNSDYYKVDFIMITGIASNSDLQSYFRKSTDVFNTINANGVLETSVDSIGSRNIYLGDDLFIYKSENYEYYNLNQQNDFLKTFNSLYDVYYYTPSISKSILTNDGKPHNINVVNYYHTPNGPSLFFVSSDFENKAGFYPSENNGVYVGGEKIKRSENICNEVSV